jgi:hypothetical protein
MEFVKKKERIGQSSTAQVERTLFVACTFVVVLREFPESM